MGIWAAEVMENNWSGYTQKLLGERANNGWQLKGEERKKRRERGEGESEDGKGEVGGGEEDVRVRRKGKEEEDEPSTKMSLKRKKWRFFGPFLQTFQSIPSRMNILPGTNRA